MTELFWTNKGAEYFSTSGRFIIRPVRHSDRFMWQLSDRGWHMVTCDTLETAKARAEEELQRTENSSGKRRNEAKEA